MEKSNGQQEIPIGRTALENHRYQKIEKKKKENKKPSKGCVMLCLKNILYKEKKKGLKRKKSNRLSNYGITSVSWHIFCLVKKKGEK